MTIRLFPLRDLSHHEAPCRWEWILKYSRTAAVIIIILLSSLSSLSANTILPESQSQTSPQLQQPYCWNEYEDVASRAFISPVVVRARCMVVYSRGSHAQFNATFHVLKILKAGPKMVRLLEEQPRIQLYFGIEDRWTKFPATPKEKLQESLLRNQVCPIPKMEPGDEYLLFLRSHNYDTLDQNDKEEDINNSINELLDDAQNHDNGVTLSTAAVSWSVYAAPEVASETAMTEVHKVQRKAMHPTVEQLQPMVITEGRQLLLRCRVKGFPHPKILWYKDGVNVDRAIRKRRAGLVIRNHRRTNRLRIKTALLEDSGHYRCVAVNVVGSAQSETTVTVMTVAKPVRSQNSGSTTDAHWIFNGVPCPERGFCLNGGTCTFYPKLNARSCNCTVGFDGPRCDYGDPLASVEVVKAHQVSSFEVYVYMTNFLCLILLFILLCFAYQFYKRTKKSDRLSYPNASNVHTELPHPQTYVTGDNRNAVNGRHSGLSSSSYLERSTATSVTLQQTDERQGLLTNQRYNHTSRPNDIPARNGSILAASPAKINGPRWMWPSASRVVSSEQSPLEQLQPPHSALIATEVSQRLTLSQQTTTVVDRGEKLLPSMSSPA